MKIRSILIFVALSILSACATLNNRYSVDRIDYKNLAKNRGVIVFSTGAAKRCISTATFLRLTSTNQEYSDGKQALFNVDGYAVKSDFDDLQGNVHALALPAGEYFLSPWIANPYVTSKSSPRFKFNLESGETLYLGEYYMPVACSFKNVSVFLDSFERDIEFVRARNPELVSKPISKNRPEFLGNF